MPGAGVLSGATESRLSDPAGATLSGPEGASLSGPSESSLAEPEISAQPWASTPIIMRATETFTGDLDAIQARGVLRVLVSYSRTNFFIAEGRLRGFEYEMFQELEKQFVNDAQAGRPPLKIAFLPLPFDEVLPALRAGHGDVAAASICVTPEREQLVAFTLPYLTDVDQVLVAHAALEPVMSWSEVAGRTIHVQAETSYVEHLEHLSDDLVAAGFDALQIVQTPRGLQTEDLLEMVNSGAFHYTLADRYLAELWSGVLSGIRIESDVVAAQSTNLAWAIRQENPQLKALLDEFVSKNKKGSMIGNVLFKRYFGESKWIANPTLEVETSKLGPFLEPLKRYCAEFDFDWRLIAAQAYQESRLDPRTVSSAGAVGLMQLLPSTAADMGVTDLEDPERSLYAGIKYMDWLRTHYFAEPQLTEDAQIDFCLAAYNAGIGRVRRWRAAAPARGLNPDLWFENVERLALEDVGMQPVQYVGNINKYFILFSMSLDSIELNERARGEVDREPSEATTR